MTETEALFMGFFYGVVIIELLVCIIKMFIDAKDIRANSKTIDGLMKSDIEAHHTTFAIIDDMATRLNVIENKLGINHEDENENKNENENEKEEEK